MDKDLLKSLQAIVGRSGCVTDPGALEPHLTEWRGKARGSTAVMLVPVSTSEVAEVLAFCNSQGIAVVPQGGNTGLCGGAIPDDSGEQVILNLRRLNRVREIRPDDFSITVEAGCLLADVQSAAADADRLFPLSLSAEGSCQIGGNLSTDAGGINVIRYGTAREQVLGLEVVLANGDVIDGLRSLRKDTAGYRLETLFVGSEGTLGIITAATLKLYPKSGETVTALVSIPDASDSVNLLSRLRGNCGDSIDAFELISRTALEYVVRHIPDTRDPFHETHDWYVLLELSSDHIRDSLEAVLMSCLTDKLITDVVIAKNDAEAEAFWRIRHSISAAQKFEGASLKHDIGVPIDRIPELIEAGRELVESRLPGGRLCAFGHVGDGNLHYNVGQPPGVDPGQFLASGEEFTEALYDLVRQFGGTFSAEHGVGMFKKHHLTRFRSEAELALMRTLKAALDPANILNPGKVLPTGSDSGTGNGDKMGY
ncbi:MAG: FAD-binding oxidoreductase [Woeseiaceae bacterium]|nr:FAD-binding oxidoreductase [Woeseiaceae bacterium]